MKRLLFVLCSLVAVQEVCAAYRAKNVFVGVEVNPQNLT